MATIMVSRLFSERVTDLFRDFTSSCNPAPAAAADTRNDHGAFDAHGVTVLYVFIIAHERVSTFITRREFNALFGNFVGIAGKG